MLVANNERVAIYCTTLPPTVRGTSLSTHPRYRLITGDSLLFWGFMVPFSVLNWFGAVLFWGAWLSFLSLLCGDFSLSFLPLSLHR